MQNHITSPPVVVSKLHPIMGLRLAALFADLTEAGLADTRPGFGRFQILSGVRTYAHQRRLYEDICLRQNRCHMVANPDTVRGTDAEGIQRKGSNHQAQRQRDWSGTGEPIEVGYAVDIRNAAITSGMTRDERAAAWAPLHDRLATYGLDWPLKGVDGLPLEEWHIEWFPRSAPAPLSGPMAWPAEPGVHRPLMEGMIGGDVSALNGQVARLVGVGPDFSIANAQRKLGRPEAPRWGPLDQRAFRAWEANEPSLDDEVANLSAELDQASATLERIIDLRANRETD